MKNVKMMIMLSGLMIGAAVQADGCSGSGVTVQNIASVPGVSYTLYVNIGSEPGKSGLITSGYKELKPGKSTCFKKGFEKSSLLYVREANQKNMPMNQAYQFNTANIDNIGRGRIEVISGRSGFELNVYGQQVIAGGGIVEDPPVNVKHTVLVDVK